MGKFEKTDSPQRQPGANETAIIGERLELAGGIAGTIHRMSRLPKLRIAVAGATGLVGRALLQRLAEDRRVGNLYALLRSPSASTPLPAAARPLQVDYASLGGAGAAALPRLDWALCALGTTIKTAGSPAAFRAVDVDAVIAFARAAHKAGARRFGVVSALGADAGSAVFYNRCKGEMEAALRAIGFEGLVIARPSLLQGDRSALGQPARRAEQWAQRIAPLFAWAIPQRYAPIAAETVAAALIEALGQADKGVTVLESERLQTLGRR